VLRLFGAWLLLVTGWADSGQAGGDLCPAGCPGDRFACDDDSVADCRVAYETLRDGGAEFLSAPAGGS
jgi:hypothetical protein